jgi:hypothetical protein
MEEWIGEIRFSVAVEAKIRSKHNLTPEVIRDAIAYGAHDHAEWARHPRYGRRLIVWGSDPQGTLVVYLRPIDRRDGLWECLTAMRTTK